MTALIKTDNAM